jgi:hypothetical protein
MNFFEGYIKKTGTVVTGLVTEMNFLKDISKNGNCCDRFSWRK